MQKLRTARQVIWRAVFVWRDQLRVACQVPLQRSPVMMPLHEPAPLLPASRPPPLALEAPTETCDRDAAGTTDRARNPAAAGG